MDEAGALQPLYRDPNPDALRCDEHRHLSVEDVNKIIQRTESKDKARAIITGHFQHRCNFDTYARWCFPDAFTEEFSDFHRDVIEHFEEERNTALGAPRGHGKTTLIGLGYASWLTVTRRVRYLVFISSNSDKATDFIEPLKDALQENPRLRFLYPWIDAEKVVTQGRNRMDMFDVADRTRIKATGFDTNIRGLSYKNQRPDLILLDDIEDDDRVRNPRLRRQDERKINQRILPATSRDGSVKMIGTVLHRDSLLVKKVEQWDGRIYQARGTDGTPLWPAMFDDEALQRKEKEMGSLAFKQEYMNDPTQSEDSIIKAEMFEAALDDSVSHEGLSVDRYDTAVLGVDFAYGEKQVNDKTAIIGLGEYADGSYDVFLQKTYRGLSTTEQFSRLDYMCNRLGVDDVALEKNSIHMMSKELRDYSFPYQLFWMSSTDPKGYSEEQNDDTITVGKPGLIHRLASQFECENVRVPYGSEAAMRKARDLKAELTTFALENGRMVEAGVHSDLGIALAWALELLNQRQSVGVASLS